MGGKLLFRGNSNSGLDWIGFTSGNFLLKATIKNKTIRDEGITVDFRFITVHTSNCALIGQKYITPPTISFVWILFGLLHREPK